MIYSPALFSSVTSGTGTRLMKMKAVKFWPQGPQYVEKTNTEILFAADVTA